MKLTRLNTQVNLDTQAINRIEITIDDEKGSLQPFVITPGSSRWEQTLSLVEAFSAREITKDELQDKLIEALMLKAQLVKKLDENADFCDRMTITGNRVFVDRTPIDPALELQLLLLMNDKYEGETVRRNWVSFMNFVENLSNNTSHYIRSQLFNWLNYEMNTTGRLTLTPDGCFVGYKGLDPADEDGTYVSRHSGEAYVNGVLHNGKIPNRVGDIISMQRRAVMDDPNVGCSHGLHVGSLDYARNWASVLVAVKVNPEHVVSVPTECDGQKIRCCEYEVLGVVDGPFDGLSIGAFELGESAPRRTAKASVSNVLSEADQAMLRNVAYMAAIKVKDSGEALTLQYYDSPSRSVLYRYLAESGTKWTKVTVNGESCIQVLPPLDNVKTEGETIDMGGLSFPAHFSPKADPVTKGYVPAGYDSIREYVITKLDGFGASFPIHLENLPPQARQEVHKIAGQEGYQVRTNRNSQRPDLPANWLTMTIYKF